MCGPAGGVSSFGYSGTIAHAVLRSHGTPPAIQLPTLAEVNCPISPPHRFPWSDPPHPLLQQRLYTSNDLALFRSPTAGRLHALVAEHVVQGRVVFPGAAYLETARAAWSASASSSAAGAGLHGVFFLQPLALDAWVEWHRRSSSACFARAVRSRCAAETGRRCRARCTGRTARAPPRLQQRRQQQLGGVAARRRGCAHAGSVDAQYETFHAAGLQYGPSYRRCSRRGRVSRGSGDGAWRGAVARLQRRLGSREVVVHPADLDGALQLGAMLQPADGKGAGKTWLPFAVESGSARG